MIAKQSVYLNLARDKVLPEGHEEAKFLLVRAGQEVAEADLDRFVGAAELAETEPEPKEPIAIPPPNLKEHGDEKAGPIPAPKIKGDKETPQEEKKQPAPPKKASTIKKPRARK